MHALPLGPLCVWVCVSRQYGFKPGSPDPPHPVPVHSLPTTLSIQYPPAKLAHAVIWQAAQILKFKLPSTSGRTYEEEFSITRPELEGESQAPVHVIIPYHRHTNKYCMIRMVRNVYFKFCKYTAWTDIRHRILPSPLSNPRHVTWMIGTCTQLVSQLPAPHLVALAYIVLNCQVPDRASKCGGGHCTTGSVP